MYKFEIIITPNEKGGYYARIPDIPSIFTGGLTEEDALKNARGHQGIYIDLQGGKAPSPKTKKNLVENLM